MNAAQHAERIERLCEIRALFGFVRLPSTVTKGFAEVSKRQTACDHEQRAKEESVFMQLRRWKEQKCASRVQQQTEDYRRLVAEALHEQ